MPWYVFYSIVAPAIVLPLVWSGNATLIAIGVGACVAQVGCLGYQLYSAFRRG